jgi:pimeloyl-ACP methyl ester carboxylesterase
MRTLGRLLVIVVLLGIVLAAVFYWRPIWLQRQATHFGLFLSHVQSNYVLTPEGRVHYYEAESRIPGGGVPLVLIHGLGDRDESWAPMLKRLKRAGFHVYAPDLLGYGRSPRPANSDYSIATQEKFVADFVQALGLQKTDLGGWSMGGWIALRLALDHPEMVDRVVVYDGAGLRYEQLAGTTMFHISDPAAMRRLIAALEPEAPRLPDFVVRDLVRQGTKNQWIVDRSVQSMLTGQGLVDADLPKIMEPLLIVWGSDDRLLPLSLAQQMHALDPRSELDVVEGCGHLAPRLCSARVASATADFLKSNPAPSGGVRTLTAMH